MEKKKKKKMPPKMAGGGAKSRRRYVGSADTGSLQSQSVPQSVTPCAVCALPIVESSESV